MTTNRPFREANAFYSGKPCEVPGCTRSRFSVSRWCERHLKHSRKHGTPTQQPVMPHHYKLERQEVAELILKNQGHKGILTATDHFLKWMIEASEGKDVPGEKSLARAYQEGTKAIDLLIEAAGLYRYHLMQPQQLADGIALTYAMGRAILRVGRIHEKTTHAVYGTPLRKTPTGGKIKSVGEYVLKPLLPLLHNIHQTIEQRAITAKEQIDELWSPFSN